MTPTIHSRRVAAATLAVLALAAPAATALPLTDRPADPDPAHGPAAQTADGSFDLDSAGLGAAATAGLVLVAAGGFAATRTRLAS